MKVDHETGVLQIQIVSVKATVIRELKLLCPLPHSFHNQYEENKRPNNESRSHGEKVKRKMTSDIFQLPFVNLYDKAIIHKTAAHLCHLSFQEIE